MSDCLFVSFLAVVFCYFPPFFIVKSTVISKNIKYAIWAFRKLKLTERSVEGSDAMRERNIKQMWALLSLLREATRTFLFIRSRPFLFENPCLGIISERF